jgi:hypothetical protein
LPPSLQFRQNSVFFFHSDICVRLMLSTPKACLIIALVSVALFSRFAQNVMHNICWIRREIASGQIHGSKWKDVRHDNMHALCEILYTGFQGLPIVSSTTTDVQIVTRVPKL